MTCFYFHPYIYAFIDFKWTFNNSAESIDVAASHVSRHGKLDEQCACSCECE